MGRFKIKKATKEDLQEILNTEKLDEYIEVMYGEDLGSNYLKQRFRCRYVLLK